MPAAPLFVILNPGSGSNETADVREQIEAGFRAAGRAFRFQEWIGTVVDVCREAAQAAAECGGTVVAVGGDGTQNSAAQAALTYRCPFGVIAQGTFNLFARDNGLPLEAEPAARAVAEGLVTPVDVGLVNQRVFLVNASLGLYPRLLADREALKQKLGRRRWVAVLSGLVSLFQWRRQLRLEVELDGQIRELRTPTLFVCNNRLQLERLGIPSELVERAGHGALVALAPRPRGRWAKLRLALHGIFGTLGDSEELDAFLFRSLTVKTGNARSLPVATDGEVVRMVPPLRFTVSPHPLQLVKPPPA